MRLSGQRSVCVRGRAADMPPMLLRTRRPLKPISLQPWIPSESLIRRIWVDAKGRITRYNLAYINHAIHSGDNGRVIGYDKAHDGHHRHYFGRVEPVAFVSFEDIEARFEQDWTALRKAS